MAKGDAVESEPTATGAELKKELQKLLKAIADDDDDDNNLEAIDRAQKILCCLKELKVETCSVALKKLHHYHYNGNEGICGSTFDRPESVDRTSLRRLERARVVYLLDKMSSTLSDQKDAAQELRLLTKQVPQVRALFSESRDAILQLLSPLARTNYESKFDHPKLQEDVITTLFNLSIHENNKKVVAETPTVIPLLINALRFGTIETRSNAAATLFTLSALDSNKALIGESGALKALIELLDEGKALAMRDVCSAIFNLCIVHKNRGVAVREGAVRVILKKLVRRVHVEELVAILALLCNTEKGVEEIGEVGGVACLLSLIRETSCGWNKENCVAILYAMCYRDGCKLRELREEESVYPTLSELAENGTARAKRKVNSILDRMSRVGLLM